jgi:phosphoribosylglycinamide formyltransferase-1
VTCPLVVLASGSGTVFQAILDAPDLDVVALISDVPGCGAMDRARRAGVPSVAVPLRDYPDRARWDAALASEMMSRAPAWVVSAGFMRILGPAVLGAFPHRIINTHPSLLPAFPGAHAVSDALASGVEVTGCTVHLVDEGVDTGPIIAQESVTVLPEDDVASLHERIKERERYVLVDVIRRLCGGLPIAPIASEVASEAIDPGVR